MLMKMHPTVRAQTSIVEMVMLLLCLAGLLLAAEPIQAWSWDNESQPIAIYRSVRLCISYAVKHVLWTSVYCGILISINL